MQNGYNDLVKSMEELAKAINDNQDALVDAVRRTNQEKRIAEGVLTKEDAFAENAEYSKGSMVQCHCIVCGNKILLHEKMAEGYCEFCGDRIALKPALRGELEETAIDNLSADEIFRIGTMDNNVNALLIEAAGKKGSIEANRMLAAAYMVTGEYAKALECATKAAKKGDNDSEVYRIAAQLFLDGSYEYKTLSKLKACKKKGFATEGARNVCETCISHIQEDIDKYERSQRVTTESSYSSYSSDSIIDAVIRRMSEDENKNKSAYDDCGAYGYPAELGASYNPISGAGI